VGANQAAKLLWSATIKHFISMENCLSNILCPPNVSEAIVIIPNQDFVVYSIMVASISGIQ
jgi:hypothetical protein